MARRYGGAKLLESLDGSPVVRRTVERTIASAVTETMVVVPAGEPAIPGALNGLSVRCVENADRASGMASSIVAGVRALQAGTRAALIVLGDQPTVTADIINRLIVAWRETSQPIVVPEYEGVRGNPVLFDALVFGELRALCGDKGARELIERDPRRVAIVGFPFPPPPDLDRPQDLDAVKRAWTGDAGS